MHFRLKFPFISKTVRDTIGTDPVNIKHPVARGCQHQLSFLSLSSNCLFLLQPVHWWYKLFLAHGVVCGMEYLHTVQPYPVIHGDLKLENVLVGDDLIAKVCTLLTNACCTFRIKMTYD